MATPVQIIVVRVTANGNEIEDRASVLMVERSALGTAPWPFVTKTRITHTHRGNGLYTATGTEPGPGEWLLAVFAETKSPVVQRLTLEERGGVLRATPGWAKEAGSEAERTAATITIANFNQAKGGGQSLPAQNTQITVRGIDIKQIVLLGSNDWEHAGTNFVTFAEGRRNILFKRQLIDEGSIVHVFACDPRETRVQVKSRSTDPKHWLTVGTTVKAPVAGPRPDPKNELGILDFYRLLNSIGARDTGSVVEASIFGHGWFAGPVIWNTDDEEPSFTRRDQNDVDGRQKDWLGDTFPSLPSLRFAFGKDGVLHVWGCSHMPTLSWAGRIALQQRAAHTGRSTMYTATYPDGSIERTSLDFQKRNIAQYVVSKMTRPMFRDGDQSGVVSYTGAAVQVLGIKCFGAPPGMGASFASADGSLSMKIIPDTETTPLLQYWKDEFGSDFDQDKEGYCDYQKLLAAKLPDPGWSTERAYRYTAQLEDQQALRVASGLEVFRAIVPSRKLLDAYSDPVALTVGGVTGQLFVAPKAKPVRIEQRAVHRYLFLDVDTGDVGIFVGADGNVLLMRRAASAWAIDTTSVPRVPMDFRGFAASPSWVASTTGSSAMTDGVLHSVTPAWFW